MSQALVDIYNQALSAAGTRALISIPTEASREAEICNLWYGSIRDQVLRAAPWPSCRSTIPLAQLAERQADVWASGDPEPDWRFAYALPDDFLYPRWLIGWQQFVLGSYQGQNCLNTHAAGAVLTYSRRQDDMSRWDADLWMAVVLALAATISMPLTGKPVRTQQLMAEANQRIVLARVHTANENSQELDSMPDWLMVRGVSTGSLPARFVYPNGPLLSSSMVM